MSRTYKCGYRELCGSGVDTIPEPRTRAVVITNSADRYVHLAEMAQLSDEELYEYGSYPRSIEELKNLSRSRSVLSPRARDDICCGYLQPPGQMTVFFTEAEHREAYSLLGATSEEEEILFNDAHAPKNMPDVEAGFFD